MRLAPTGGIMSLIAKHKTSGKRIGKEDRDR
jgi:hypothetical protein